MIHNATSHTLHVSQPQNNLSRQMLILLSGTLQSIHFPFDVHEFEVSLGEVCTLYLEIPRVQLKIKFVEIEISFC